jgi:hypothetical protein
VIRLVFGWEWVSEGAGAEKVGAGLLSAKLMDGWARIDESNRTVSSLPWVRGEVSGQDTLGSLLLWAV